MKEKILELLNKQMSKEEMAEYIKYFILNEQDELLSNLYYGKDLKDKTIRKFYKMVLREMKYEINEQIKEYNVKLGI
jgi:hypothetical protein